MSADTGLFSGGPMRELTQDEQDAFDAISGRNEDLLNELIAVIWPALDNGVNKSEIRDAFDNALDSWMCANHEAGVASCECNYCKAQKAEEWSGSPDPQDPDNYWIDDKTGERVNAITGERSAK